MKKSSIHVCFLISDLGGLGGTERVSFQIANGLCDVGYTVSFVDIQRNREIVFSLDRRVKTYTLLNEKYSIKNLHTASYKLRRYIKYNSVDFLISCAPDMFPISFISCFMTKTKTIHWEHFNRNDVFTSTRNETFRKLISLFFNNVVTITNRDLEFWNNKRCFAKLDVINNPTCFETEYKKPPLENKTFLSVGRLVHQKGFDRLIKSWEPISKIHNGWVLKIVGDGEDRHKLVELISELNLENSVYIEKSTKSIEEIYKSSSAFVMASRYEGFGLVLVEACSFGLPIVSVDFDCGASEIISGDMGWVCEQGNKHALTDSISNAISEFENKSKFEDMSYSSWVNSKRFSHKEAIKKWDVLLKETV